MEGAYAGLESSKILTAKEGYFRKSTNKKRDMIMNLGGVGSIHLVGSKITDLFFTDPGYTTVYKNILGSVNEQKKK
jgi:hypothetical protein